MQQLAKLNITLGQVLSSLVYVCLYVGYLLSNQSNMTRIESKLDAQNEKLIKIEKRLDEHSEKIDNLEIFSAVHEANELTLSFLRKNPKMIK